MECLLSEKPISAFSGKSVLILILMECLLRNMKTRKNFGVFACLNPYSNGMLT